MAATALSRHAGAIATCAGVLLTVTQVVGFVSNLAGVRPTVHDTAHMVNALAMLTAFAGLAVATFALYGWHAHRAGTLGALGVGTAVLGTVFAAGDLWFATFAVPFRADASPRLTHGEASGWLTFGALTSSVLFTLGWVLFGLSGLRPRVFPPAACVALVVGGIVGFRATVPPYGVPLGLALIWLGAALIRATAARATYDPVPL